jgi:hypothetical protein
VHIEAIAKLQPLHSYSLAFSYIAVLVLPFASCTQYLEAELVQTSLAKEGLTAAAVAIGGC